MKYSGIKPRIVGVDNLIVSRAEADTAEISGRRFSRIAVVDRRRMERECFVRTIRLISPQVRVDGYASTDDWVSASVPSDHLDAILFSIGDRLASEPSIRADLRSLADAASPVPVIVLAESEELQEILAAMDSGAVGYIPASVGVDAIVDAATLASSGGSFLPAASLRALRDTLAPTPSPQSIGALLDGNLTCRQAAVAEALRRGKPNKIIAYELRVSESTVKIHIRSIMKKLNASNRTEAAFRLNHANPLDP